MNNPYPVDQQLGEDAGPVAAGHRVSTEREAEQALRRMLRGGRREYTSLQRRLLLMDPRTRREHERELELAEQFVARVEQLMRERDLRVPRWAGSGR